MSNIKIIQMVETRDTEIGFLRSGQYYSIDLSGLKEQEAFNRLISGDAPPAKEVDIKEVAEHNLNVKSLMPVPTTKAADPQGQADDLAAVSKKLDQSEKARADLLKENQGLQADNVALQAQVDDLQDRIGTITEEADTEVASLTAELEALKDSSDIQGDDPEAGDA